MMIETTASWTAAERAAFAAKRRSRNIALGVVLGLLVVMFFGITIVKMSDSPAISPPAAVAS
jgi:hypothetical protein